MSKSHNPETNPLAKDELGATGLTSARGRTVSAEHGESPLVSPLSPDRQRDAKIAEALGLKPDAWELVSPDGNIRSGNFTSREDAESFADTRYAIANRLAPQPIYDGACYSTDPVAFDSLMAEIGRRGLGPRYVQALASLVFSGADPKAKWGDVEVWGAMSAPQSIRAAAALAVLTEAANG